MRRSELVTLGASVAAALVVVTVGSAGSAQQSTSTDLLRVAATAAVTTWDPVKSFSTEVLYMANIYEPLVYANPPGAPTAVPPGPRQVVVEAATTARPGRSTSGAGVTFHDGEPLTSTPSRRRSRPPPTRGGASFIWAQLKSIDDTGPV